jgi:phage repressor protein C with HTH and peptisase S24 domain
VLVSKELSQMSNKELDAVVGAWKGEASGQNLRVLATVVNAQNEEEIELISEKVSAGYTSGYSDPSYLQELPTLRLPFLSKDRKYRAFPIIGDSMPPVVHGSYVVGEFVQDWLRLASNTACIVVTKEDGIVFKYVQNLLQEQQILRLSSSNPLYAPFDVNVSEVIEVWRFVSYISRELPDVQLDNAAISAQLRAMQADLQAALRKENNS